jgi:hypothetical protein
MNRHALDCSLKVVHGEGRDVVFTVGSPKCVADCRLADRFDVGRRKSGESFDDAAGSDIHLNAVKVLPQQHLAVGWPWRPLRLRGINQSARTLLAYQVGTPCSAQFLTITFRVEDQAPPVCLGFGNEWKQDIPQFRCDGVRLRQPQSFSEIEHFGDGWRLL